MNVELRFELRVAELVEAYADRAPLDIDPEAVARAVASSGPAYGTLRLPMSRPTWAITLLAVTLLLAVLAGALSVGRALLRPSDDTWLAEPVPPFIGLPPQEADPSEPASGELVLSFAARMPALGMEAQQSFLYADGRFIWQRNLEGSDEAQQVFGDIPPTTAIIEQRLTAAGVALVLADVLASRSPNGGGGRPGATPWGGIDMVIDGQMQHIEWADPGLPARLADPGSWVPATAWADATLRGYVPSQYAICLPESVHLADLPTAASGLIPARAGYVGPGYPGSIGTCYNVTTDAARTIAAALDEAGVGRVMAEWQLAYDLSAGCCERTIYFQEVLPDGRLLLRGG